MSRERPGPVLSPNPCMGRSGLASLILGSLYSLLKILYVQLKRMNTKSTLVVVCPHEHELLIDGLGKKASFTYVFNSKITKI